MTGQHHRDPGIEPVVQQSPTGLGLTYSHQARDIALAAHSLPPGSPERRAAMRRVTEITVTQGRELAERLCQDRKNRKDRHA